ncbi:hypothetical protein F2Q69_00035277 [Brassica cretica]|uniref:Uncharacterized protein n=1 Tax=Brassica cretica TaxID=69181 RepID=A0A8S9SLQ2_BRACR|nr:hypothetical protein F2Q69_00035277 [Brassica cretica]
MNSELLAFPSSLVGGRPRPRHLLTDPFSSPIPSWGDVPEADSEAVMMAPPRRRSSSFFDDGPHSEIREGDLANMRRKYVIHPSVGMRSPSEFEHAPDGGARSIIFLWFMSFSTYSPYLEDFNGYPMNKAGFYHLRSRDGTPLVEEPSKGIGGNYPFGDGWNNLYVFVKIQEPFGYLTSWCTVDVSCPVFFAGEAVAKLIMGFPLRFRWVTFLVSKEALRHSRVWGSHEGCGRPLIFPTLMVLDMTHKTTK